MTQAFETGDRNGKWLVLTDAPDLDHAMVTGEWIKTTEPVDVEP